MLRCTSPPVLLPLSIDQALEHVVAEPGEPNTYVLERLMKVATHVVQTDTARQLIAGEWTLALDCVPATIELRVCPVQSVTSLKYYDTSGVQQTLDSSDYLVDTASEPGRIVPVPDTCWPDTQARPNAVEVVFSAGYGDSRDDVPAAAKQAILLLVGHWFANREAVGSVGSEIGLSYRALINSLKWTL